MSCAVSCVCAAGCKEGENIKKWFRLGEAGQSIFDMNIFCVSEGSLAGHALTWKLVLWGELGGRTRFYMIMRFCEGSLAGQALTWTCAFCSEEAGQL